MSHASVLAFLVLAACGGPAVVPAPRPVSTALTVYNQDRALVKDTRTFSLAEGLNLVRFDDVTSGIVPGSVQVAPAGDGAEGTVAVLAQSYEYDLVSTPVLLQRHLGREVEVTTEEGRRFRGRLLSGADDVILQRADGGVTVLKGGQVRDVSFPDLPEGLASKPSLVWDLESARSGDRDLTVTYATSGFTWSADYVVRLSDRDDAVDVSGWVTVDNRSEATFRDANLKLVAGKVAIVEEKAARRAAAEADALGYGGGALVMGSMARPVERGFFDYHLYEMPRRVTLAAHEKRQVQFVEAAGVPAEVTYRMAFDGYFWGTETATRHPVATVKVRNDEASRLGVPLPEGTVRVYKADTDGADELVGESHLAHTPRDEQVELTVGEAFDLVGEWKETDHRVLSFVSDEFSYALVVRNHKAVPAKVTVEHLPHAWGEWRMVRCSSAWSKPDSGTLRLEVDVPADGETRVTYTIRTRW